MTGVLEGRQVKSVLHSSPRVSHPSFSMAVSQELQSRKNEKDTERGREGQGEEGKGREGGTIALKNE